MLAHRHLRLQNNRATIQSGAVIWRCFARLRRSMSLPSSLLSSKIPVPEKIQFVRVPSPMRPLALLFVVYHFMAPFCYLLYRLRGGAKFDLVQALESNLAFRRHPLLALLPWHVPQAPLEEVRSQGPARLVPLARSSAPRLDGKFYLSPSETGRGSIARPGKGAKSGIPLYREQADCIAESHQPGAVTNAGRL